jgi:hypothetical protein
MLNEEDAKAAEAPMPEDPHNQPKIPDDEVESTKVTPNSVDEFLVEKTTLPAGQPAAAEAATASTEKKKQKRFTLQTALFGGGNAGNDIKKLKKERRKTLPASTEAEVAKLRNESDPASRSETKTGEPPVSSDDDAIPAHPAVRPLSAMSGQITDGGTPGPKGEAKGKEREEHASTPMYTRCACCGRMKRPQGYDNALSPVIENENLRTNLSFEVDRTATTTPRRSSDANRAKFTPIIPMITGPNDARQASVEPYNPAGLDRASTMIPDAQRVNMEIATSSPVQQSSRPKPASSLRHISLSLPTRFTRFASLHGRKNGETGPIAEVDEEGGTPTDENSQLLEKGDAAEKRVQLEDPSLSGANKTFAQDFDRRHLGNGPASSIDRTVIEQDDSRLRQPSHTDQTPTVANAALASGSRPNSDVFFTPATGITPISEPNRSLTTPVQLPRAVAGKDVGPIKNNLTVELKPWLEAQPREEASMNETRQATTPTQSSNPVPMMAPRTISTSNQDSAGSTPVIVHSKSSSPFEEEIAASFLTPYENKGLNLNAPQHLRPKFSFESQSSAMHTGEHSTYELGENESPMNTGANANELARRVKPTGKRRSMIGGLLGPGVKA